MLRYASRQGRFVVATAVLGSGMTLLDSTVVNIALPAIGNDFHTSVAGLQWIVTAYLLTLSGLLLLGGALGDRYGRRRILLVGVTWFAAASLCCGLAPDEQALVVARAVQGAGGALLMPGSLAILQSVFVAEDRGRAIGAWTGLGGLATAVGPFLGGWLIAAVSWRLIFFINLPVAAAVVVLGLRHVPETRDPMAPRSVDVTGGVLVTAGLVGLTYGLIEGPSAGWSSAAVLVALVLGAACVACFVVTERHRPDSLVPLELFASRQFSAANAVTFAMYGALGGALFLLPVELEQVGGYSPLEAGASLLPITACMAVLSPRFGALATRIGPRLQMGVGPIVVGAGLLLLVRIGRGASFPVEVLPAMLVFGLGLSLTVAPLTATVLAAAPRRFSGIASAVNNDVARLASLVAVAVLPSAAGLEGLAYLHPASLSRGFHVAAVICALSCAAAGVLAAATIRNGASAPTRSASRGGGRCSEPRVPLVASLSRVGATRRDTIVAVASKGACRAEGLRARQPGGVSCHSVASVPIRSGRWPDRGDGRRAVELGTRERDTRAGHEGGGMAGSSAELHEDPGHLRPGTVERHRAIVSVMEELEAIDWYDQRVDASTDPELAAVLAHNRDEEKEHAMMTLEWLRRHDATLDQHMRTYLFTSDPITAIEGGAAGGGLESSGPGTDDGDVVAAGSLGIGSLRGSGL